MRSRFMPVRIHFPPYSENELVKILERRAEAALHDDAWDVELLRSIASLANGDARIAIGALRCAAEHAEMSGRRLRGEGRRGGDRIGPENIHEGFLDFRRCHRRRALLKLTRHHRIIYHIIESNPDITSTQLMEIYREKCSGTDTSPVARRTFSHYLARMRDIGLIEEDQARERGRVRCFKVR